MYDKSFRSKTAERFRFRIARTGFANLNFPIHYTTENQWLGIADGYSKGKLTVRLATFVHISDLHFGDIDINSPNKDAVLGTVATAVASNIGPVGDGLLGHCHHSLVRLEQKFAQLKSEEEASLIVTGDLTAYGAESQFDTASDFLGGLLWPPRAKSPIGLREKKWNPHSIPGNHDHWSGNPVMFGSPTPGLAKYFSGLPSVFDHPLSSGQLLTFLRVDSDADVSPYGSNRFLARGCFTTQLDSLSADLPVPQKNEIRVLLVHHSFVATGTALVMTALSKAALNDFIVKQGVSVMLCGHVHQPPAATVLQAVHLQQKRTFIEARSGTTTQISTLPLYWRNLFRKRPGRPKHWPNSFLVHRLFREDDGSIAWEIRTYFENSHDFSPVDSLPDGAAGTLRFKVWAP